MTGCDGVRVPAVLVAEDEHPPDCPDFGQPVVQSLGVDGVNRPDVAVPGDSVAGSLHRLVGVGHPADPVAGGIYLVERP